MRKKFTLVASLAFAAALCAGAAAANIHAEAATWSGFEITATSVRIGDGTKTNPSGLRFQTVAESLTAELKAQYPNAECYTKLTFTSSVEGASKQYSTNVPATVWAEDNVWNTVLLEIPASDYGTVITAQSFIKLNDTTTYETAAVSSSIAKTASRVMQMTGIEDATLKAYAAGALESITLNETSGTLTAGDTVQLTATTAPEGFGVLWSSADPSIATVDNTGKVTAVGAGTTTITASMAGKEATYTVTSKIPYTVDFENGANVYIKGSSKVTVGNVTDVDGGSKGVPLTVNGFDIDFGISAAWLANAFANPDTTGVSFKLYTTQDGNATYNGYGGAANEGLDARGTLMYMQDGALKGAVWDTWANSNKDCPAKVGGYIPYTISRAKYNAWVSAAQSAGVTSDLYLSIRVGINENRQDISGFGYGVVAPGTVYIDDLKANIPVKYDPINNNPLEQDGTFENGVNALVTSSGVISYVGLEERVAGNNALKFNLADSQFDIYFGLNRTYLANAFDTKGAKEVTFKLYTDADGWCEKHRWSGENVRNGDLWYNNGSKLTRIQENVLEKKDKVDGYIPVTITKVQWQIFKNGDPTGTSDLFIYMVLGVYNNGARPELANDVLIHDTSVGNLYVDDVKAVYPALYDPINNNPLEQDGTFENGVNALVTNFAPIVYVDVEEVTPGNHAVKLTMPANSFDIYVGLNAAWLENAFVTQQANTVTFKVYTALDGWGTYNKFNGNGVGNGEVGYVNNGTMTKLNGSQASVGATEKTNGYLTLTLDKNDYTAWVNAKGSADCDLYIMIRLGKKEEGKTGFGYGYAVGDIYIDDLTVNK